MQPMNYNIDVADPFTSSLKGFQTGQAMQQQQAAQQQARASQEQNIQMQQDLASLSQKADLSANDVIRMTVKYPQLSEHFKSVLAPLSDDQKQNKISTATQVYAALQSGNTDIANDILQKQLDAAKNSGNAREAAGAEANLKIIQANPGFAKTTAATFLAEALGPEKFTAAMESFQKTPGEIIKLGLESQKLGLEVNNLPTKQALDNQNAFEDVETKKLNRNISVLDAKIKSADSETKRGQYQLEKEKFETELSAKKQEKQAAAQDSLDVISRSLNILDQIDANPVSKGGLGGVGSYTRQGMAKIPGTNARDFDNLLETARSQQFSAAISTMKGMGALSDAEGKKIEKAVASLDPDQSEPSFRAARKTIRDTLVRAQAKLIGRRDLPQTPGAPSGGSTFVMNHPKYGVVNDAMINSLLESKPGMTREQALQFFQSSGGK